MVLGRLPYFNLVFRPDLNLFLSYLISAVFFRFTSKNSFTTGIILFLLSIISFFAGPEINSEYFANASYLVFFLGVFQWLKEYQDLHGKKMTIVGSINKQWFKRQTNKWLIVLFLSMLAFLPRIFMAVNFFGTTDTINANDMANVFFQGENVYATGNYPYPPLWLIILAFSKLVSLQTAIPNYILFRIPAILADVVITNLLFLSARKLNKSIFFSMAMASLYALNPAPILISGYHGQVDSVWILSAVLCWYIFEYYPKTFKNIIISASILCIGIVWKVFPILFIPLFLMKLKEIKKQLVFTVFAVVPLIISIGIPFLIYYQSFVASFVNYSIEHNFWGISAVVAFLNRLFPQNPLVFSLYTLMTTMQLERIPLYITLMLIYLFLLINRKHLFIPQGMLLIVSGILLMTPFISIQWWLWLIPFSLFSLSDKKTFLIYSAIVTVLLLSRYYLYLRNIADEYQFIKAREVIKGIKIDLVNKTIAFGLWLFIWNWFIRQVALIRGKNEK